MEIRAVYKDDDRKEISKIYEQSWKFAYNGLISDAFLESIEEGHWADAVDREGMSSLVLVENGRMIGTSSYCKSRFDQEEGYGEIVSLYLLPEYIGKGYGKILLSNVIRALRKLGYVTITLWVLEKNDRAIHFYKNNGFFFDGIYREDLIGGKVVRELQYIYSVKR